MTQLSGNLGMKKLEFSRGLQTFHLSFWESGNEKLSPATNADYPPSVLGNLGMKKKVLKINQLTLTISNWGFGVLGNTT